MILTVFVVALRTHFLRDQIKTLPIAGWGHTFCDEMDRHAAGAKDEDQQDAR